MAELNYFYIQQWVKDEQNRDDGRDMVYSDDDSFTLYDDVPIVEENPYSGEYDGQEISGRPQAFSPRPSTVRL